MRDYKPVIKLISYWHEILRYNIYIRKGRSLLCTTQVADWPVWWIFAELLSVFINILNAFAKIHFSLWIINVLIDIKTRSRFKNRYWTWKMLRETGNLRGNRKKYNFLFLKRNTKLREREITINWRKLKVYYLRQCKHCNCWEQTIGIGSHADDKFDNSWVIKMTRQHIIDKIHRIEIFPFSDISSDWDCWVEKIRKNLILNFRKNLKLRLDI